MTMATSAVMTGLMPNRGTRTAICSTGQAQKVDSQGHAAQPRVSRKGARYLDPTRKSPGLPMGVSSALQNSSVHAGLLAALKHYGERPLRHSQIGSEPERLRIHVS